MKNSIYTYLVFGATGRTGRHFVSTALHEGHKVIALVRNPDKVETKNTNLKLIKGSIIDYKGIDELMIDVDFVICMIGDAELQKTENVNAVFIEKLIPAMRRKGVKRLLYQAGGFTRPYKQNLTLMFWLLKQTLVRFAGLLGQHRDNEAVIKYLVENAADIEWMVHRAGIAGDGSSKGILKRSKTKFSIATFADCAKYNYDLVKDHSAIHSCDLSYYVK